MTETVETSTPLGRPIKHKEDADADVEFRKHLVAVLTKWAVATAAGISS